MSYPKLGHYRNTVNQIRKKYKVTALDFDLVLYMSEQESVNKYELRKNVTNSLSSINTSLAYMTDDKVALVKVVRKHRTGSRGLSALYAITVKGRNMVTDFYMKMFPNQ